MQNLAVLTGNLLPHSWQNFDIRRAFEEATGAAVSEPLELGLRSNVSGLGRRSVVDVCLCGVDVVLVCFIDALPRDFVELLFKL